MYKYLTTLNITNKIKIFLTNDVFIKFLINKCTFIISETYMEHFIIFFKHYKIKIKKAKKKNKTMYALKKSIQQWVSKYEEKKI